MARESEDTMFKNRRLNDSVLWYMNELTSRVVAGSGIPSDRHHLGKIILQGLKDTPDFIHQIDGATGEKETNRSVFERSVKCAMALKKMGLKKGDVIILMAPTHNDLAIPFYAALYLGVIVAPVDYDMDIRELDVVLRVDNPKLIFCESKRTSDIKQTIDQLNIDCEIVTFDKGKHLNFDQLLKQCDSSDIHKFQPSNFNTEEAIALLIRTSGTTGVQKSAAATHKNFSISPLYLWIKHTTFPTPTRLVLLASRLQWLTAVMHYVMSPFLRYTRLQCSLPTISHQTFYNLINTYKPSYSIFSTTLMYSLIKSNINNDCDFTCFETIILGGTPVPQSLMDEMKKITPRTEVLNVYGITEICSVGTIPNKPLANSSGTVVGCFEYKLIDIETQEEIIEPKVSGELCLKGPSVIKEYYNNSKETKGAFTEDGFFKTGDLFYKDENENMFFVDRLKLLLKYNRMQISPVEVENVIRKHPHVLDAVVVGVPDPSSGDLLVAYVVPRETCTVTAQQIKDVVRENLADYKQLRGGVIFMPALPMTPNIKVDRRKLKAMAPHMKRE